MSSNSTSKCPIGAVDRFGPATSCPGAFDFTLLFEETILTILPAVVSLAISCIYGYYLRKSDRKVAWTWHSKAKLTLWLLLCITSAVQIGLTARTTTSKTRASLATCVIVLTVHIVLAVLSQFAHLRSARPWSPILIFLSLTLVFDAARSRTLWNLESGEDVATVLSVSMGLKALLLVLESLEKRDILLPAYRLLPPDATANMFNQWFCWWLNPLLLGGYKRAPSLEMLLEADGDLYILEGDEGLAGLWDNYKSKQPNPSLMLVCLLHNKKSIAKAILPRLSQSALSFAQPFLVGRVMEFIARPPTTQGDDNASSSVGTGLIVAYVIVYVGIALATSLTQRWTVHLVTRMRAGLVDLIYRRTLEIQCSAVDEANAVTLMSADVERIATGLRSFHELWASPIEIALSIWLLSRQIRLATLAPALVILFFTGAAIVVASKAGIKQKAWLDKIQTRVTATASLLGAMKAVKMTGLTETVTRQIKKLRDEEIKASFSFRMLTVKILVLTLASTAMAPLASFGMYILLQTHRGYPTFDPALAITALALLQLLLIPVSLLIDALAGTMSAVGCFQRIQQYLNSDSRVDNRLHGNLQPSWTNNNYNAGSLMRSLSSRRQSGVDVDLMLSRDASVREIYHLSESQDLRHMVATQNQSSVLLSQASFGWNTAEKPILKGLDFNIPRGKLTMIIGPVGSGKSTLLHTLLGETRSGGGSIQVSFKDAAYCSQRPWISNTTVRQNILGGFGFDPGWYSTVVHACSLAHDFKQLPDGDLTRVGSNGGCLSGGQQARIALARAVYSKKKTMIMDDVLSGLDPTTEEAVFSSLFGRAGLLRRHKVTVILATNAVHRLPDADHIVVLGLNGRSPEQGTFAELSCRAGYVSKLDLGNGGRSGDQRREQEKPTDNLAIQEALAKATPQMQILDGSVGDLKIYKYYIESFGWLRWWIFTAVCAVDGFCAVFPNVWGQRWAEYNVQHPGEEAGFYFGIYFMLGTLSLVSLGTCCGFFAISIAPRVARTMHTRVLNTVMKAPTSFLSQANTGSLTNRFSQDMGLIDMELPVSLIYTVVMIFILTAQTLVIVTTARYAGAALPFCMLAGYATQKYYLRTSRVLRLLDIEAKSLLLGHFLETLEGLVTIRAFGWAPGYVRTNAGFINVSQRPAYLLLCVQRWLGVVLDLLVSGIAVTLAAIAVKTRGRVDAGLMGLALLNIVGFSSTLKQLITNWTLLETSAGAVSRVRSFTSSVETEEEQQGGYQSMLKMALPLPRDWPQRGAVEFNAVTASYTEDSEPVLRDISLKIEPGQRIGICGRSGSGKSSLLATLFGMTGIRSGSITIDGVDISTLSHNDVRLRLNALPQQPFLVPGTVRQNVDPLDEHGFDAIVEALHLVGLWDQVFCDLPGGLDADMPTSNLLSFGQKQLLCLARALLRRSSVLVLDEPSSSVDLETEAMMQRLIDTRFAGSTVIAVAHRLDTILDFDRVAVVDGGRIVEWGHPRTLLRSESAFRRLYRDWKGLSDDYEEEEQGEDELVAGWETAVPVRILSNRRPVDLSVIGAEDFHDTVTFSCLL